MALKGDLASVDLAQVFQMLALNQKVGLLSIQSRRIWKVLYFDNRGVTLYYNEHTLLDRVLASLIRGGHLVEGAVNEAREHAAQSGTSVVESLLAGGYTNEQDLESTTRLEMEEEIYDLFFCRDARFEFFEGATSFEGREGIINDRFFFSTDSLIMEAARRIDEWSYIKERIPGPQEIFTPSSLEANVAELDDSTMSVLDLVDSKRNVVRIVEVSGMATFHVFKSLALLLDEGLIEPVPADVLIASASQCMDEGRLQDSINLLEKAIAIGVGIPQAHTLAAEAYQASQQFELAVYHLKCDAEYRAADGELRGAVESLRHAIQILPTDLSARERLVELTIGQSDFRGDGFDPIAEGKMLVDLYMEIGDLNRVRGVLERLLRENPDDLDLKRILINVHTKAGDTKRVIELYESLANDLVRAKRPIEAVNYLQKILMIDRSRSDISQRVRSLYEMDERSRSRRRNLVTLGALFCVIVALGAVYYSYDRHAWAKFESLDVASLLEAKEFGRASTVYKQFVEDYPLTMAVKSAQQELSRIDAMRHRHDAEIAREGAALERELGKIRSQYKELWRQHREDFMAGDPEKSLRTVEHVRELIAKAGKPMDLTWSENEQVEKTYKKLRDYLSEAAALERTARGLLDNGDWQGARAQLLELVGDYEITKTARNAVLPVMIRSRPNGAEIRRNGKPLTREVDGQVIPVTTPSVVFCSPSATEKYAIVLSGFEPKPVAVDARRQEIIDAVLNVVPVHAVQFSAPPLGAAGAARNLMVVGLRGGRLGLARIDTGKVVREVKLGGLREVLGRPVVALEDVFFLTNEGTIEGRDLQTGQLIGNWPTRLDSPALFDPVVGDGRLLVCDREGRLLCFDKANGRRLWTTQLEGVPAGPPVVQKRLARIATQDGRVNVVDVSTGDIVSALRSSVGITTRTASSKGLLFFGCSDGSIRAVDETSGRIQWNRAGRRALDDEELLLTPAGLVVTDTTSIHLLRMGDGERVARADLPGDRQHRAIVVGRRIFAVSRIVQDRPRKSHDILQARDLSTLEVLWEYTDGGNFVGPISSNGQGILLPASTGEVVCFR